MFEKLKKTSLVVVALGALALGGSALANAKGGGPSTSTAAMSDTTSTQPEAAGTETNDAADPKDGGTEANDPKDAGEAQATGPAAEKAKAAALASVGSGKVTDVEQHHGDTSSEAADTPEPGDTPDAKDGELPASVEKNAAWDVEVTKADGSAVDVTLDSAYTVLATAKAEQG